MNSAVALASTFATAMVASQSHRARITTARRPLQQLKKHALACLLDALRSHLKAYGVNTHTVCIDRLPSVFAPGRFQRVYVRVRETQSQREVTPAALQQAATGVTDDDVVRAAARRAARGLFQSHDLAWWDCVVHRLRGLCITTNQSVEMSLDPGRRTVVKGNELLAERTAAYQDVIEALNRCTPHAQAPQTRGPSTAQVLAQLQTSGVRTVETRDGSVQIVMRYKTVTPARLDQVSERDVRVFREASDGTQQSAAQELLKRIRMRTETPSVVLRRPRRKKSA